MALLSQANVADLPQNDWRRSVLDDLTDRLAPPSGFPCTFSQNAFNRGLLQFSFVEAPGVPGLEHAADDLRKYVSECQSWDGRIDSAKPLVMVFSEKHTAGFDKPDDYRALGWDALQFWHDNDAHPWPADVSKRPDTPFWSFCFAGMQLFINMSTPAHTVRRSRNLGRRFTLVINPRERFDIVAGDTPEGQRVRQKIRRRSEIYDGQPHSSLLGSYQKGDLEWVQYFLPDHTNTPIGTCPFRFRD